LVFAGTAAGINGLRVVNAVVDKVVESLIASTKPTQADVYVQFYDLVLATVALGMTQVNPDSFWESIFR
jgi:hypothetical protein